LAVGFFGVFCCIFSQNLSSKWA